MLVAQSRRPPPLRSLRSLARQPFGKADLIETAGDAENAVGRPLAPAYRAGSTDTAGIPVHEDVVLILRAPVSPGDPPASLGAPGSNNLTLRRVARPGTSPPTGPAPPPEPSRPPHPPRTLRFSVALRLCGSARGKTIPAPPHVPVHPLHHPAKV